MTDRPTILAVDDTESNIDMLNAIFKNYDVISALNGHDAIEIARNEHVDLMLLDIVMPGLDGFEVCKILKDDQKTKSIPIVFITSKTDEDSIEHGYEIGGIDYVTKPFKPKELLARARTHIELKRYQASLEEQVESETSKRLIQEKALIKSARLAEMGEMISVITHQWKQPLSALSIMVSGIKEYMVEENVSNDEIKQLVDDSMQQINHMSSTIETFKNFLKTTDHQSSIAVSPVVSGAIEILRHMIKSNNIKIEFDPDESAIIRGCENELKQAFINILKNAIDAIVQKRGSKGGLVVISIKNREDGVKVLFEDSGGGIDEALLPDKIFEQYISTKGEGGTGLGLSICKIIIEERFGGTITARNGDYGACFEIFMPRG